MTNTTDTDAIRAADPFPDEPDKSLSPINAAMIAGGVGCLMVGVFTTLAEMSQSMKDFLDLYTPVGPLAGKTSFAVGIWLIVWLILHFAMRTSKMAFSKALTVTLVLIGVGLLFTFPLFFQAFA